MSNIIFVDFSKKVKQEIILSNDSEHIARLIQDFQYDPSKTEEILAKYQELLNNKGLARNRTKK